ncbi:MAG: glutamyl-tRNA reductase [Verrucomicrobiales bacterium]|nr:glutamyl-tRNA reductase [Verrucomicrobiales bacterium]
MHVFCIGLSHRTAPVELRERFAVGADALPDALSQLRGAGLAGEAVWLSTCNRVELYAVGGPNTGEALRRHVLERTGSAVTPPDGALYLYSEPHSIEHLFRVASGLDSMVLGETEILGQLKKAYETARQHGHTGPRLNKAFQRAFNVAKQIRSETNIQRGGISVASVSVELAEKIFETVENREVVVIGAGDTGEKVARALISRGVRQVLISNRSPEKAELLATSLGERARPIGDWMEAARHADVLISSTSSPGFVLDAAQAERLMHARQRRPLLLIDLAVPRDIDPTVIQLSDVYLFNVDDLQAIAEAHRRQRESEVARCEEMIRSKAAALLVGAPGSRGDVGPAVSAPA